MGRSRKEHFYYTCLRTEKKVFAYEGDKARILENLERLAERKKFDVLAFTLLDDEFHLLYAAVSPDVITGEEIFAELTGSYLPSCGREYEESDRKNAGTVTQHELREAPQVVECCMDIHMRSVEETYVSSPNDYWWASYPVYRGQQLWDFVASSRLLKLVAKDPVTAGAQLIRSHRERLKMYRQKRSS